MKGTPEDVVILHWVECRRGWENVPWSDWVQLRGSGEQRLPLLVGATAGVHYFVVCMLGERGELANVIPHKYVMAADGRLVQAFDGLGKEEREERARLGQLAAPTFEQSERYQELCDRGFAVNLPPPYMVPPLMKSLPGLIGAGPSAPCWRFLSAIGITGSSMHSN